MDNTLPTIAEQAKSISRQTRTLEWNNPVEPLFSDALQLLGGPEFIAGWAEENPAEFIGYLVELYRDSARMHLSAQKTVLDLFRTSIPRPNISPQGNNTVGGLHIHVAPGLQPGPLDRPGDEIDVQ